MRAIANKKLILVFQVIHLEVNWAVSYDTFVHACRGKGQFGHLVVHSTQSLCVLRCDSVRVLQIHFKTIAQPSQAFRIRQYTLPEGLYWNKTPLVDDAEL